jgi:hypothetical protein
MTTANAPPTKKRNEIEIRYRIAIRLWSRVSSQDFHEKSVLM